jgi:hypothetical protein
LGKEDTEDEDEFEIVGSLDEASKSFQSPAKRFKFSSKHEERETLFEGEDEGDGKYASGNESEILTFAGTKFEYVNKFPHEADGADRDADQTMCFISMEYNKVAQNFKAFHLAFIRERKIHKHVQSEVDQMLEEVKVQLNNLDGRTRLLSSRLGKPGGEEDAQSLWEHLEDSQRDLMDTQMVLDRTKHRANEFEKIERATETRLNGLELKNKESGGMEENLRELKKKPPDFCKKVPGVRRQHEP